MEYPVLMSTEKQKKRRKKSKKEENKQKKSNHLVIQCICLLTQIKQLFPLEGPAAPASEAAEPATGG